MMLVVKQFNAFILSAFYFQALALHLQRHKCLLTHRKKEEWLFYGKKQQAAFQHYYPHRKHCD